jgi:hypothetical protein
MKVELRNQKQSTKRMTTQIYELPQNYGYEIAPNITLLAGSNYQPIDEYQLETQKFMKSNQWKAIENLFNTYKAEGYMANTSLSELKASVKTILSEIYRNGCDAVSLQLTGDESIMFSIKRQDLIIYLEYFPVAPGGEYHYLMNVYQNKNCVIDSLTGSLPELRAEIRKLSEPPSAGIQIGLMNFRFINLSSVSELESIPYLMS